MLGEAYGLILSVMLVSVMISRLHAVAADRNHEVRLFPLPWILEQGSPRQARCQGHDEDGDIEEDKDENEDFGMTM